MHEKLNAAVQPDLRLPTGAARPCRGGRPNAEPGGGRASGASGAAQRRRSLLAPDMQEVGSLFGTGL